MNERSIADLAASVEAADVSLRDAEKAYATASHNVTAARNFYNQATRDFDEACSKMREAAPRDSDWAIQNKGDRRDR